MKTNLHVCFTGLHPEKNFNNINISTKIFFALFLVYIFPFKPHGSLFTTSFATLLWFLYSINLYYLEDDKKK